MQYILLISFLILSLFAKEPGKDHPLITRFPGSSMTYYYQRQFDEYTLLQCPDGNIRSDLKSCKKIDVSGKLTKIKYLVPSKHSGYEVYMNYLDAFRRAGYKILANIKTKNVRTFIANEAKFKEGHPDPYDLTEKNDQHYYISAVTPKKDAYISVYYAEGYRGRPGGLFIAVVEPKQLELGKVDAKTIADKLQDQGHIALYGIYFDFDKATIKPESKPTLDAIAKYLRDHPNINVYIVGHTDNKGTLRYNMRLSKKRAKAVYNTLIEDYHIKAGRMAPFGVGPLAPVASNRTEAGRAKNRRVELVEQ